jgi:hypothetical protein
MNNYKIISLFLKKNIEFVFFASSFFCKVFPNKSSKNFKLKTGTALIAAITLISACNEKENNNVENKNTPNKLQKLNKKVSSATYSKVSKIIYLHMVSCFANTATITQKIELNQSEILDIQFVDDTYQDARCYMPPPPEDSMFYNMD